MKDYTWIQERSEGLYYAELQEMIQTVDWTLAWKQLKEAFLPYIEFWNDAVKRALMNLSNNPEFMASAKMYMNAAASASNNFQGNVNPKINLNIKPTFPDPKPVKVGQLSYDSYHSKIDCKNLISPTKEQYCKDLTKILR